MTYLTITVRHWSTKCSGRKKYIKLSVYKDRIEQTISDEKIEFDDKNVGFQVSQNQVKQRPLQTVLALSSQRFLIIWL